jgi:hypothetical protein
MKSTALPFLLAFGLGVSPAFAQTGAQEQGAQADTWGAAGGHGFSSGASNGMRAEAGADLELAQAGIEEMQPQPQTRGDVTYLCGGIGQSEARFMNQQASEYDLKLTFASQSGAYLADVNVDIRDARGGEVLQVHCGAPILLVDLPRSGTYRIQADAEGFTQTRTARVNAGRMQTASNVVVSWPQSAVAQMEPDEAPLATGGVDDRARGGASGAAGNLSDSATGSTTGDTPGTR